MKMKDCSQSSTKYFNRALAATLLLVMQGILLSSHAQQQPPPSKFDIERFHLVLGTIKEDIRKNYYDTNYHGVDLDAAFKAADAKIKQATSLGQLLGIIGQLLVDLDDSHTFFLPPRRSYRTDYGWRVRVIGEKALAGSGGPRT